MADELAVWLYGNRVATIDRHRGRPRLLYAEDALSRYELGTPLLSLSLPVSERRYTQGVVRPFIDGLLPEGESRKSIARDVGVRADDTYGLIAELGRDCAGAIVIQPADEAAPGTPTTVTAEALTQEDAATLVRNLRSAPLGAGGRVRVSLAGVQEKLLLTRMPDGKWGRPVDGTPSTHILKPEIAAFPKTVENEAFCMRIAHNLSLAVAGIETTEIAKRRLIVVERFDRTVRIRRCPGAHSPGGLLPSHGRAPGHQVRAGRWPLAEADRRHTAVRGRRGLVGAASAGRDVECVDRQRRRPRQELLVAAPHLGCVDADAPLRPHVHAALWRRATGDVHRRRATYRPGHGTADCQRGRELGHVARARSVHHRRHSRSSAGSDVGRA